MLDPTLQPFHNTILTFQIPLIAPRRGQQLEGLHQPQGVELESLQSILERFRYLSALAAISYACCQASRNSPRSKCIAFRRKKRTRARLG